MRFRKIQSLLLLWMFVLPVMAQHSLEIVCKDGKELLEKLKPKKEFTSAEQVNKECRRLVFGLREQGYLMCSADSLVQDSLHHTMYLVTGKQFRLAVLRKGNAESQLLSAINYAERLYAEKQFSPSELSRLFEKILVCYEDHGFPFASVKLDSLIIKNENISAALNVTKNRLVRIDSVIVQGDLKVSKTFLYHYLDIRPGALYNETAIRNISGRLKQLPFAKELKPAIVRVTDIRNKIYVFAGKKNASQFDGIIGLLPSPGGKTIFTGDAKIRLQNNVFKAGETIELNWRRLQSQTQDLKTRIVYPYIFKTFAGVEHSLKLYRKDTTFIDVLNNVGIQYIFKGLNNVKGFYRQRNSNLLSTSSLAGISTLPDFADITTRAYGLGVQYEKLDYKFNPRKGISIVFSASAGSRLVRKNAKLNEIIYNGVQLNSSQYQGEMEVSAYVPLFKRSTLKFSAQASTVYSEQIFRNELFRIGGLKTLRGFDEESISASTFGIGSLEYRFLFDENSAIFLFAEGAWYERNFTAGYSKDTPMGIGAGISFETKAGIFSLNYALGSQQGNGFDIRSGKIHFGIVNAF